jgi:hypothetical protein
MAEQIKGCEHVSERALYTLKHHTNVKGLHCHYNNSYYRLFLAKDSQKSENNARGNGGEEYRVFINSFRLCAN